MFVFQEPQHFVGNGTEANSLVTFATDKPLVSEQQNEQGGTMQSIKAKVICNETLMGISTDDSPGTYLIVKKRKNAAVPTKTKKVYGCVYSNK